MLDAIVNTIDEVDVGSFRLELAQTIGHGLGDASKGVLSIGDDCDFYTLCGNARKGLAVSSAKSKVKHVMQTAITVVKTKCTAILWDCLAFKSEITTP